MIKTIMPKHGTSIYDESWTVVLGIVIGTSKHYMFDMEKKETYYKILIQNSPPIDRHANSIYSIDTPDSVIMEKENELPF